LIGFTEESREISPKMIDLAIRELRRENLPKSYAPLLWRLAAAAAITVALVSTGFIIGQYIESSNSPSTAAQASLSAGSSAATPQVTDAIKSDLEQISELDCATQGFNELARLWNIKPVVEYNGKTVHRGLELVAARRGMRLLNLKQMQIRDIVATNAPCLLELSIPGIKGTRYIALTRIGSGEFFMLSPVSKMTWALPEKTLATYWTGTAYLLWRNGNNLPDSIQPGTSSVEIRKLQTMLAKAGSYSGKPSGTFDSATQEAVRKFQKAHFITPDGVPGPRTLLNLYRACGETKGPNLSNTGRT
jgi:general secretion pathway protein A